MIKQKRRRILSREVKKLVIYNFIKKILIYSWAGFKLIKLKKKQSSFWYDFFKKSKYKDINIMIYKLFTYKNDICPQDKINFLNWYDNILNNIIISINHEKKLSFFKKKKK